MTVKATKLVTGEEIIGKTEDTSDGRIKVTQAVTLRMFPSQIQGGDPSMGFQPFPALSNPEKPVSLLLEPIHVVYSYVPDEPLVDEYNRMFSGGMTSSSQIITG